MKQLNREVKKGTAFDHQLLSFLLHQERCLPLVDERVKGKQKRGTVHEKGRSKSWLKLCQSTAACTGPY